MTSDAYVKARWFLAGLLLTLAGLLPVILRDQVWDELAPVPVSDIDSRIAQGRHVYRVSEGDSPRVDVWLNGSSFHPCSPVDITIQVRPMSLGLLQKQKPDDSQEITVKAELLKGGQVMRTGQAKLAACRVSRYPTEYRCTWFDPFQIEYPKGAELLPLGRYVIRLEVHPQTGEVAKMPDFPINLELLR